MTEERKARCHTNMIEDVDTRALLHVHRRECKEDDVPVTEQLTAFTMKDNVLGTMLTTQIGSGCDETTASIEALGMMRLLRCEVITKDMMDQFLVSKDQLLVSLIGQLVSSGIPNAVMSLVESIADHHGLTVLPWKHIMEHHSHESVPEALRPYVRGCVDKNGDTQLAFAIYNEDAVFARECMASPFGAFGCSHVPSNGTTVLQHCIVREMNELCAHMLEAFGPKICKTSHVDANGDTALMLLLCQPRYDPSKALELLLDMGAQWCNPGNVNNQGETALLNACRPRHGNRQAATQAALKILDLYPSSCKLAAVDDNEHFTALMRACQSKLSAVALRILDMEPVACQTAHVNSSGRTALMYACESGMTEVTLKLLGMGSEACSLAQADVDGSNALIIACEYGLTEVALKMIDMGPAACKPGQVETQDGQTPLIIACTSELTEVALKIIDMGPVACRVAHVDDYGDTALISACANGLTEVALKLLDMGPGACRTAHVGHTQMTPLTIACESGMTEVALKLLDMGPDACDPARVVFYGNTALTLACENGLTEVALKCLGMGAAACKPEQVETQFGQTPLIIACSKGLTEVALKIIDMGPVACRMAHVSRWGVTALMAACRNNMTEVASKLLSAGRVQCRANHVDSDGLTALDWERMYRQKMVEHSTATTTSTSPRPIASITHWEKSPRRHWETVAYALVASMGLYLLDCCRLN